MWKEDFTSKWKEEGFIDCLRESWITNIRGRTETAIDYVMTAEANLGEVVVHKPIRPLGKNLHLLVPFNVGPALKYYKWLVVVCTPSELLYLSV
ncbi:hypothetical protein PMAYCL1PPCAC_32787, partial [Pristionchus mayeri]